MASLRDIRNRISSVRNTQQVTRAMKMVAAAKLRRSQERIFQTRPYAFQIGEIISHLRGHVDPASHELFAERGEGGGTLLILVTADRGLAGAFNTNIIKLAEETIAGEYAGRQAAGQLYLLAVGRKGHEYFAKRGYTLVGDFRNIFRELSFETARQVVETAVEGFRDGRWNEVKIVYNEFRNTITQNRIVEPLLPIPAQHFLTPVMEQAWGGGGGEERAGDGARGPRRQSADYIFEPDAATILETLVPRFLTYQVWRVLLESNAAEQGARMVAMDNATTNADEILRALRLQYNRARQSAITKEILEIISGANALESSDS